jgi:hypothetical protein
MLKFKKFFIISIPIFLLSLIVLANIAHGTQAGDVQDASVMGAESPWAVSSGNTVFNKYDSNGNLKAVMAGVSTVNLTISGGTIASHVTVDNPVYSVAVSGITSPVTVISNSSGITIAAMPNVVIGGSGVTVLNPVTSSSVTVVSMPSITVGNPVSSVTIVSIPSVTVANPVSTVTITGITNPVTVSGITENYFHSGETVVGLNPPDQRKYGYIISDIHNERIQEGISWRIESSGTSLATTGTTVAFAITTSGTTIETWFKIDLQASDTFHYQVYNAPSGITGTLMSLPSENPHMGVIGGRSPELKAYWNPSYTSKGTMVRDQYMGTWGIPYCSEWRILSPNQTLYFEFTNMGSGINYLTIMGFIEEVKGGITE